MTVLRATADLVAVAASPLVLTQSLTLVAVAEGHVGVKVFRAPVAQVWLSSECQQELAFHSLAVLLKGLPLSGLTMFTL